MVIVLRKSDEEGRSAIFARGRSFGEGRNVRDAHWYSDVVGGRMTGAAAVAKLHAMEEFQAIMATAKREIARAHEAGLAPNVDCEEEVEALATPLY